MKYLCLADLSRNISYLHKIPPALIFLADLGCFLMKTLQNSKCERNELSLALKEMDNIFS